MAEGKNFSEQMRELSGKSWDESKKQLEELAAWHREELSSIEELIFILDRPKPGKFANRGRRRLAKTPGRRSPRAKKAAAISKKGRRPSRKKKVFPKYDQEEKEDLKKIKHALEDVPDRPGDNYPIEDDQDIDEDALEEQLDKTDKEKRVKPKGWKDSDVETKDEAKYMVAGKRILNVLDSHEEGMSRAELNEFFKDEEGVLRHIPNAMTYLLKEKKVEAGPIQEGRGKNGKPATVYFAAIK